MPLMLFFSLLLASGSSYRMRHSFREKRLAQTGCPTWESTDKIAGTNCTINGQSCAQTFDPCYCPASDVFPEAFMLYPGYFEFTCTGNPLTWANEFGVDGACPPECSNTPLCDPGQIAYSLPQPGVNVVPTGQITCGTNVSDCYICAPPGPVNLPAGLPSSTINISVHCTPDPKTQTYFSAVYSNTATITKAYFSGVTNDLIATVNARNNDSGTIQYEWCDKNNHYGSFYLTFQGVPAPPVPKTCAAGQQSFYLPQPAAQIPVDVGAPSLSCASNGISSCQVCAPPTTVNIPSNFMVSMLCGKSIMHANFKGYSSTIKLNGNFGANPPKNYTATVTGQAGDSGWVRVEWCDNSNKYGAWVVSMKA